MSIKLLLVYLVIVLIAGCSVDSRTDYINNARQLTLGTDVLTAGVLIGKIPAKDVNAVGIVVHVAHDCSTQWYYHIKDPNIPAPDAANCATQALLDIIIWQNKTGLVANKKAVKAKVVSTDADIDSVKLLYDSSVIRFDNAVK